MVQYLARDGMPFSRDRTRSLLRRRGLRAIYQKPRTTRPGVPSELFPYLAGLQLLTCPDRVWETDITFIPHEVMPGGPGDGPLASGRKHQIFHLNQDYQFTLKAFVDRLRVEETEISLLDL